MKRTESKIEHHFTENQWSKAEDAFATQKKLLLDAFEKNSHMEKEERAKFAKKIDLEGAQVRFGGKDARFTYSPWHNLFNHIRFPTLINGFNM